MQAEAAGIRIAELPFIRTEYICDDRLTANLEALRQQQVMAVFTSRHALAAAQQLLGAAPASWTAAGISGKTSDAVAAFFGEDVIRCTAANAKALADKIIKAAPQRAVFFCGDQRLDHLPQALAAAGIPLTELVVYRTIATPERVTAAYRAVLFFSPSAVHSFFSVNTLAFGCTAFAIGDTTAATLTQYTSNTVIVSPESNEGTMIRYVIHYYNEE